MELRASGAVGLRWQVAFGSSDRLEWIDSTCRRTRRTAARQAQMTEKYQISCLTPVSLPLSH